jgi:transposase InsO family protein
MPAGRAAGQVQQSGVACRIDLGVDERGTVTGEGLGERGGERRAVADRCRRSAHRLGGRGERGLAIADGLVAALARRALLDLDQAQRGVVEHDHDHPQPEPDRGLDFHQRHAEPAVPGERDHRRAG